MGKTLSRDVLNFFVYKHVSKFIIYLSCFGICVQKVILIIQRKNIFNLLFFSHRSLKKLKFNYKYFVAEKFERRSRSDFQA